MHSQKDTFKLANGVEIPCLGFGTWQTPDGETCVQSVRFKPRSRVAFTILSRYIKLVL